jgi:uncharacterized RDD family membrane protein YckC
MTGDLYVESVISHVPARMPLRDQIAMELRSHIEERLAAGQPLDEVLRQLGNPLTLAESYLSAVPLKSAPIVNRVVAKLLDALMTVVVVGLLAALAWTMVSEELRMFIPVMCAFVGGFGFVAYTVAAEYYEGQTVGKRVMGIQVVRESGARISLGQSVLRQLPFLAQFFWIDALFALFTDRKQRAFELLTKTRAVAVLVCVGLLVQL